MQFNRYLSIRWKLVVPFLLVSLLVLMILLPIFNGIVLSRVENEVDRRLTEISNSVMALLEDTRERARLSADFVANLAEVRFAATTPAALATVLTPRKEELGLQELSFYAPDFEPGDAAIFYGGPTIARRLQVSEDTIRIRDELILEALATGTAVNGVAIAPQSSQIIGASLVHDEVDRERIVGVVLAVFYLNEDRIATVSDVLAADVAIVKDNAVIVSTIDGDSGFEQLIQQNFLSSDKALSTENITYGNGISHRLLGRVLTLDGIQQGYVLVSQPVNDLFQVSRDIQLALILFALAVTATSLLVSVGMVLSFAQPVTRIAEAAHQISLGNLEQRVETSYFLFKDEITDLSVNFNSMAADLQLLYQQLEQRVADRTQELEQERNRLSETLGNLKMTQGKLVEAEKMAALGGLVAGVAHEINTPVGVGVTAASLLEERTSEFLSSYHSGEMKRSDLEKYLELADQSSHMLLTNLRRAAELIESFKQVAVDQSSEVRRTFSVRTYLKEILLSLRPKLKQTKHVVEVPGEEDVLLDSYPGAFAQVVTNLMMNSLIHAYGPDDAGRLTFTFRQEEDRFIFEYADDGYGIPAANLDKIFEPFFTTKRNQGGSGLGLHIIYNLVTQTLNGTIHCQSEEGQGSMFVIVLPLNQEKRE